MFEGKRDGNFKKDPESNGESNVWCKADGEKEDRGPDEDARIEAKETAVLMEKANGVRCTGMCWGGMMGTF